MSELTSKLNAVLQQAIERGEIAGANLLVLQDGKELAYTEVGYANIEEKKPYKRDTICRFFSLSKPITATAAMILMERGQLELGQPVGDIIEAFKDMKVRENGKRVPVRRNLLVKDLFMVLYLVL